MIRRLVSALALSSAVVAFNCTDQPTGSPPTTVHGLRPRDIDVVGALGDSLTSAFGAKSTNLGNIANWIEYRGISFSVGGDGDADSVITVGNIIKFYNPFVFGLSVGETPNKEGPEHPNAQLNQARTGAFADDLPEVARSGLQGEAYNWTVAAKTKLRDRYDSTWKLLTIFIGSNNLCWSCSCANCNTSRHDPDVWKADIVSTLDYLSKNVPRLFVNLMLPIDTSRIFPLKSGGAACSIALSQQCNCGASDNVNFRNEVTRRTADYIQALEQVADQFDSEDMAVVIQPWLRNTYPPTLSDGTPDRSYFAPDCFHFSAKAHEAAAIALWDNMISPVTRKADRWTPGESINCPGPTQLLCTKRNQGQGGC